MNSEAEGAALMKPSLDIASWVRASRARQDLPPRIEDPKTIDRIAALILASSSKRKQAS
ncbi:MAG: hypothetical protein ACXVQX_11285 [Actinomycetota bacterium]